MKKIILVLFLFVATLNAQNKYILNVGKIKEKKYHTTFDFENVKGKIIIDVTLDNKVRKFFLDTGAPTSISNKLNEELQYKVIDTLPIHDANGKKAPLQVIKIPQFSINGLTFVDTHALSISDMSFFDCFNVEGIIGSNSLRNSVVDFDFKQKKITISSDFKLFEYGKIKGDKLFFKDFQSTPILNIKMELGHLNYNEELIFDSGDDSFYKISTNNLNQLITLISEKKIPKELQNINQTDLLGIIASSTGSFAISLFGNEAENKQYKFKIQDFVFGGTRFNNIIATTSYGSNSRIGSEILNYGRLTLDYKRKKYYFQENENQNTVDVKHNFYGIYPTFVDNKFVVGVVWDEQIKGKVKVGEEIIKINNYDLSNLSKCEIFKMSLDDYKNNDKITLTLLDKETKELKEVEMRTQ
jgi:hypothetical protein